MIWIIIEEASSAGGGVLVLLALAMMLVLFLTPIVGTVIAFKAFSSKDTGKGVVALVIAIAAAAYLLGHYISVRIENKEYNRGSGRLYVEITDKENVDEDTFAFALKVTNETVERIIATDIDVEILNYKNETLLETKITDIDCDTGETEEYRLLVNTDQSKESEELFYTDYQYLRIEITINALDYNDRTDDYYFNDHRVLKEIDENALKKEYKEALRLFKSEEYEKAIEKFSRLGGYKDSMEKIKEATRMLKQ